MSSKFLEEELDVIKKYLSNSRLETYKKISKKFYNSETVFDLLAVYKRNIESSKSLYELLSYFEVFFRNAIDIKLTQKIGKNWFNKIKWRKKHRKQIKEAKNSIKINKNMSKYIRYNKNDLISNLSLGFWVHLFDGNYEKSLWIEGGLNKIFSVSMDRNGLNRDLREINNLRNRISHYEIILTNEEYLTKIQEKIIKIVNYINPILLRWLKMTCSLYNDACGTRHQRGICNQQIIKK
jgi:hypothetical protein